MVIPAAETPQDHLFNPHQTDVSMVQDSLATSVMTALPETQIPTDEVTRETADRFRRLMRE